MTIHKSVMLEEVIEGLNLKEGSVVVDATLGGGGHSLEMLKKIGKAGKLIAIDQDERAINDFKKQFRESEFGSLFLIKGNFADLKNILWNLGVDSVDAILADLGYSSDQLESVSGLSFMKDAPLDMRLSKESELTAEKIVNEYDQYGLEKIIREHGEERFYKRIVKKILEARKMKRIETTRELVEIIESAVPEKFRHGRISPATKTFQALRIEVNRELENLEKFIPQAVETLSRGGLLAIITFHSLEDRIVKNIFRENARGCICPPSFPVCQCGKKAKIRLITKKPIIPSEREIEKNPRARSAKLRICEKI